MSSSYLPDGYMHFFKNKNILFIEGMDIKQMEFLSWICDIPMIASHYECKCIGIFSVQREKIRKMQSNL